MISFGSKKRSILQSWWTFRWTYRGRKNWAGNIRWRAKAIKRSLASLSNLRVLGTWRKVNDWGDKIERNRADDSFEEEVNWIRRELR